MATLISLLSEIIGHVPGCPDFLIEEKTLEGTREFCRETWIWEDEQAENQVLSVDPLEEDIVYDLTYETGEHIIGISVVTKNDTPMNPGIDYVKAVKNAKVIFSTPFSATDVVEVKRVYRPSMTATEIPDFLVEEYGKTIAHKATAELLKMENKPWSNASKALYHENLYKAGVQDTQNAAMKGNTNQSQRVYMRDFG